jgi:hypothetical protein
MFFNRVIFRWLVAIATALSARVSLTADLQVPQQFMIAVADGTVATATVATIPGDKLILLIHQPDGTALIRYICKADDTPVPVPPVPPVPVPQKLSVAIVADPATTTPQQAAVIFDRSFHDLATKQHTNIGVISPNVRDSVTKEVPPQAEPFLRAAKGQVLPWVVFIGTDGKTVLSAPVPSSSQELIALLKKHGG